MPADGRAGVLSEAIERGDVRCAVAGLGFIGTTLMHGLLRAGFETHGYDVAESAVRRFESDARRVRADFEATWSVGTDPAVLAEARVVFVAVRLPIDGEGRADEAPLAAVAAALRAHPASPRLVLLESTVPPGATRRFAAACGPAGDPFVAHTPERLSAGDDWRTLRALPHLAGGIDAASTDLAAAMLSRICDEVVPVSCPEVSELSKLLENAFLSVGIGLVGEITALAHAVGIDAAEVCDAAATKSRGYYPFRPGAGVGGHCLPNDLKLLTAASRARGLRPAVTRGAEEMLALQPSLVVARLGDLLGGLEGKRVLIVGVGFKPGSSDTTLSPAAAVVRELRSAGAEPVYLDAAVPRWSVDLREVGRIEADELEAAAARAAVLVAGDSTVELRTLRDHVPVVLDAGGAPRGRYDSPGIHRI